MGNMGYGFQGPPPGMYLQGVIVLLLGIYYLYLSPGTRYSIAQLCVYCELVDYVGPIVYSFI